MTWQGWLQIAVFAALITAVVKPLGGYIVRNVDGGGRVLRAFAPLERGLYRVAGIDPAEEQGWVDYAMALLWFHLVGIIVLYALLRLQNLLPLNPQQMDAMTPDLALNTAVSFATNTSWQSYGGESTLSYLSQMLGSWCSRSCRLRSALRWRSRWCAVLRAVRRRSIGNFWVDLTRVTLYVLLPICVVAALIMIWQGVPQTLHPYVPPRRWRARSNARTWAGRHAEGDRGDERRRRRLLQRQLGASIREPDRLHRPDPDAADDCDRRRADQHLRPNGRRPAAWLGAVRGDGDAVHGRPRGDLREPSLHPIQPCRRSTGVDQTRRQHGRQGGPLRHRPILAVR